MNKTKQLFSHKAIILNLSATTKNNALKEIAAFLKSNGFIKSEKLYLEALQKREREFSTGLGNGIGIPHAQHETVLKDVVLIARSKKGINWDATDQELVHVIFTIALNPQNASAQTDVLQELSSIMMDENKIAQIRTASSKTKILDAVLANTQVATKKVLTKGAKKIIAITACPSGIAHTFLAADAIKKAADELGYEVKVETQGRNTINKLSDKDIQTADAIIFAIDKGIEGMHRFNGQKVLTTSTKAAIKDSKKLLKEALAGKGEMIKAKADNVIQHDDAEELSWAPFKSVYKNLMGGVSRMLPFVIAGGIMIGLAFLLDSGITGGNLGVTRDISRWFAGLGKVAFSIFVPILGAYVAYSIIGSEGLMPGLVAGLIASGGGILYGGDAVSWSNLWGGLTPGIDQGVLAAGSGFIGAMVGGYIAAAVVLILRKYIFHKVTRTFQGVVAIIAMPVFSLLLTGLAMFMIQMPLAYVAYGLKKGLEGLADNNLLFVLGIIIGLMMAVDMGGPINKVAYVFATSNLVAAPDATHTLAQAQSTQVIMHAVMVSGMVPPLVIAFSTLIFKKAYSDQDRQAGVANWLMGAFFITEGAIPFAAKDPKRVIPMIMMSSAIAGAIVAGFQVGITAPHGGIFVFALVKTQLINSSGASIGVGILITLGAMALSTILGGFALGYWKTKAVKAGKLTIV